MKSDAIAAMPGYGIDPECLDATLHALQAIQSWSSISPEINRHEVGAEHHRHHGVAIPNEVLQDCLDSDAVLLDAIGLPDVRKPDGTKVRSDMMMGLRRALGLDAAVRSVKLDAGVMSPLHACDAGIEADATSVDAMRLFMLTCPSDRDVWVMENQFGDILCDLDAAIVGGLGMAPSAEINNDHALFQPSHGTAPQLAGKSSANPIVTILFTAIMLYWLGTRHDDAAIHIAGPLIESTVATLLKEGRIRTQDQGGAPSTSEISLAVTVAIEQASVVSQ